MTQIFLFLSIVLFVSNDFATIEALSFFAFVTFLKIIARSNIFFIVVHFYGLNSIVEPSLERV